MLTGETLCFSEFWLNIVHVPVFISVDLEHLRYIDFSNGEFVDDWFLARLQAYRESLEFLDISGCSRITEQGLLALHHLR